MRQYLRPLLVVAVMFVAVLACVRQPSGPVIIVTATPPDPLGIQTRSPADGSSGLQATTSPPLPQSLIVPTMDPPRFNTPEPPPGDYIVQPGDSLSAIAEQFGTTIEQLMELNTISNASLIAVGQVLRLPSVTTVYGPAFKIIPDSELVRSPATAGFDIPGYVASVPGYLSGYKEIVDDEEIGAAEAIRRVSDDYSVNPRLLLALLEYRSGWLFNPDPAEAALVYPMGFVQPGYEGLSKQLSWAANLLNDAYYGWRLRDALWFTFSDGIRVTYAPGVNAGTVAVQYLLSRGLFYSTWLPEVEAAGFYSIYVSLFGDPFAYAVEPLLPASLTQPVLQWPWSQGETWYFTGGPHGGYASGSAWAAIDFAPPGNEDTAGCFVAEQPARAAAPGIVVRSERGFVVLDLDGDGDETTGWTLVYLHLASEGRVAAGVVVQAGDPLGYPSCEGGVSTATHLHLSRRYNGEWIPVQCHACAPNVPSVPMVISGWTVFGWEGQEYQGYMTSGEAYRQAEQGRDNDLNELQW